MTEKNLVWFLKARFGLFVHYGLYSLLERGEWVMNRERMGRDLSDFNAKHYTGRDLVEEFVNCDPCPSDINHG